MIKKIHALLCLLIPGYALYPLEATDCKRFIETQMSIRIQDAVRNKNNEIVGTSEIAKFLNLLPNTILERVMHFMDHIPLAAALNRCRIAQDYLRKELVSEENEDVLTTLPILSWIIPTVVKTDVPVSLMPKEYGIDMECVSLKNYPDLCIGKRRQSRFGLCLFQFSDSTEPDNFIRCNGRNTIYTIPVHAQDIRNALRNEFPGNSYMQYISFIEILMILLKTRNEGLQEVARNSEPKIMHAEKRIEQAGRIRFDGSYFLNRPKGYFAFYLDLELLKDLPNGLFALNVNTRCPGIDAFVESFHKKALYSIAAIFPPLKLRDASIDSQIQGGFVAIENDKVVTEDRRIEFSGPNVEFGIEKTASQYLAECKSALVHLDNEQGSVEFHINRMTFENRVKIMLCILEIKQSVENLIIEEDWGRVRKMIDYTIIPGITPKAKLLIHPDSARHTQMQLLVRYIHRHVLSFSFLRNNLDRTVCNVTPFLREQCEKIAEILLNH